MGLSSVRSVPSVVILLFRVSDTVARSLMDARLDKERSDIVVVVVIVVVIGCGFLAIFRLRNRLRQPFGVASLTTKPQTLFGLRLCCDGGFVAQKQFPVMADMDALTSMTLG